ncbi:arginine repressor [Intestinimonas sp. MSJ-38]|uniref:arginine repressor n=1 Tax=Intestinimonas sp. MSJ-38 TaxID=2841532 RepID=UPI000E50DF20|nr:arginine repressor [Intestinimonas sp. MSJ-38]MBU5433568.1 arginine repressor [Intestinimonas sp. MSJ-38]RHO57560.1 arginine repressor [Ruminococcaceae bacterium AM07-15]RHT73349.1 arginine repressor [Ruminococcaceae bacterium AM28-23LB]
MKFQRQAAIIDLISNHEIDTQEELTARLREMGFHSTQATISRDIKELRLIKIASSNGGYKYSIAESEQDSGFVPRVRNIFRECVIKVDVAQNLVVIKTITGMANAAAFALDTMKISEIVGTIAGDDNVLIILRDNESAENFFEQTKEMLR